MVCLFFLKWRQAFFINVKLKVQENYTIRTIEKKKREGIRRRIRTSANILKQEKSKDQKKLLVQQLQPCKTAKKARKITEEKKQYKK